MTDELTYVQQGNIWIVFLGTRCHIVRGITSIEQAPAQIARDMEMRCKWAQMWTPVIGQHPLKGQV